METDLTPTEARAEVEAFMGEGWRGTAWKEGDAHFVGAYPGHAAQWTLRSRESLTYRAAVEAPCPHRRERGDEVWCELGDRDHLENDPVYVAMEESE